MNTIAEIQRTFKTKYTRKEFCIDKFGEKTIEIIGASFLANQASIFAEPNKQYIEAELEWYKSQSTNIKDLPLEKTPKAWKITANKKGEINSNYGKLIFNEVYHNQFDKVKTELEENPNSRRASMIYTRPSIWEEYKEDGKNDFICTNAVTYYIRDNKIYSIVQMRSNDVVFGYKNDYAWQYYVLKLLSHLLDYEIGDIVWQVQNLHIYEKHFKYLEN